ncbi:MAG: class I SAM-dependent methyltransferase [Solirubrobacteraceae bacterium]
MPPLLTPRNARRLKDARLMLFDGGFRRLAESELLLRALQRRTHLSYVGVDYPPTADNRPRFGWDRPSHPRLAEIIGRGRGEYAARLHDLLTLRDDLLQIGPEPTATEPGWRQDPPWLVGLDAVSLYGFMRLRAPARYVEIGSGNSTKFAARARRDGALQTRITSIDPSPRAEVDELCDEVVRGPLETADLDRFAALGPGDIVFFDGSHRAFMNSDAVVFFLEVLPSLRDGVLVGIHDILLPWDYPPRWAHRYYSEQYLLACFLLAGGDRLHPVLPCHYVSVHPELSGILDPLWSDGRLGGPAAPSYAFWLSTPTAPQALAAVATAS